MDKRLFINLTPGITFIDRLSGTTKVRAFLLFAILTIATWDIRFLFPFLIFALICLISLKPNWKTIGLLFMFILITNLFNFLLLWLVKPNYGFNMCGSTTILHQFNSYYIITAETLWYFLVRFLKLLGTFVISLVFILSITPSEIAAGLYSIKIPYKVCTIVSIAFRYIPDISRDYQNIKISMQARGMELDSKKSKLTTRVKQTVLILVPLIITSFERVGNIANAMDLRGYGKQKTRTYYSEHEETSNDKKVKVFYLLFALFLIGYIIIARIMYPWPFEVWYPWL